MATAARAVQRTESAVQPFEGSGYAPIPHWFWELLPGKCSGMVQFVCIGLICDRTWGAMRRKGAPPPKSAAIANAEFRSCFGNNISDRAIQEALQEAAERKLIAIVERPGKPNKYEPLAQNWASAPFHEPAPRPAKEEAPEDEAEREIRVVEQPLTLRAGKRTEPLPLPIPCQKVSFESNADGLEVDPVVDRLSGVVHINLRSTLRGSTTQSQSLTRIDELREALTPLFLGRLKKLPDDAILGQIAIALDDAPVKDYGAFCALRLKRGKVESGALFVGLAREAADAYATQQAIKARFAAPSAASVDPAALRAGLEEILADPRSTPDDRVWAKRMLEEG